MNPIYRIYFINAVFNVETINLKSFIVNFILYFYRGYNRSIT